MWLGVQVEKVDPHETRIACREKQRFQMEKEKALGVCQSLPPIVSEAQLQPSFPHHLAIHFLLGFCKAATPASIPFSEANSNYVYITLQLRA